MSARKCPCNGCTTETGRGPGCHNDKCPRGWYERDQKHTADRTARNKARGWQDSVDGFLAENAIKTIKKHKRR